MAACRPEPFESGGPFEPDLQSVGPFLAGLPTLSAEQRESLDEPFELAELAAAVEGAAAAKSPGLDGYHMSFIK